MIYIGKFLHATNQQKTKEEDRRHGEFNLIIEADNEQTAIDRFKERITEFRGKTDLFEGDCFILNQAVRRNEKRFPEDFMFQMTPEEMQDWKSQIVISNTEKMGLRKSPLVFTEQGVSMLSSVLRSARAVQVNIAIMRTFVRLREMLATHKDIARKIEEHDRQIANLYAYVERLLRLPEPKKNPIGYIWPKDNEDDAG